MDKLSQYRSAVRQVLTEYAGHRSSDDNVETQLIVDAEHDHYQLFYVGWENQRRVYGCVLHFDIKNEKIWIQHNGTEIDVAAELVKLGVDKQDIVLGFQSPAKRQFTEYAVS
jgi:hypothetical protein